MPLRLAYEASGAGPPVLILHGVLGSGRHWRGIGDQLAPRHRVVCVDLRNHGHSPWAATMEYAEMADDVRMLIDTLRLGQPAVLGHGMGGKTAMALALLSPRSVGRLIVVDIAPVSYVDRLTPWLTAMQGIDMRSAAQRRLALQRMQETMPDSPAVAFLTLRAALSEEHFDDRINFGALAAAVPTLCEFPPELLLHTYAGPTALIHGALSDRVQPAALVRMAEAFPLLQTICVDGAGHWAHTEQPLQFLAALESVLGDPARPAADTDRAGLKGLA